MTTLETLGEIKHLMMQAGITRLTLSSPTLSVEIVTATHAAESSLAPLPPPDRDAIPDMQPQAGATSSDQQDQVHTLHSRHIGRFQHRHLTRKQPAIIPGMRVIRGEILGFIRDGMTIRPIHAENDGTVTEILQTPGALIGYGTALITYRA